MSKTSSLIHPGVILREEFFVPLGITQLAAAQATGIPQSRLSEILAGRRAISAIGLSIESIFTPVEATYPEQLEPSSGGSRLGVRSSNKTLVHLADEPPSSGP